LISILLIFFDELIVLNDILILARRWMSSALFETLLDLSSIYSVSAALEPSPPRVHEAAAAAAAAATPGG